MAHHASAEIRQAPGWWPSLVQVVCPDCGYRGPVRDLNAGDGFMTDVRVRIERDNHRCHDSGEEDS